LRYKDIDLIQTGFDADENVEYLQIEIIDTGRGIPANKLQSIFMEMHSDQENSNWDGLGLGLPVCLELALQLRSFIR